jgi:2-succinyl-6-hydroxy-2,4-cyclohexadiene-1-carboxylate synthase
MAMPYAQTNGVRYHYLDEGQGETLVALHGFTGSAESWNQLAAQMACRFRIVRFDLLGHGLSDTPNDASRYCIEKSAADLVDLLRQMDIGPINLLGYSMGGRLALYLALFYPDLVSHLILESASPGLGDRQERQERLRRDDQLARDIEVDGIKSFVNRWEQMSLFESQAGLPMTARAELRRQRLQNRASGLASSLRGMGTGSQPPLWSQLARLRMPTLLLAGELDHKFAELARGMGRQIPSASVVIISEAGHAIHLEQPARFETLIRRFIGHE